MCLFDFNLCVIPVCISPSEVKVLLNEIGNRVKKFTFAFPKFLKNSCLHKKAQLNKIESNFLPTF